MSEEIDHHTSQHQSGAIRRNGADVLAVRVTIRNHAAQPARRSSMQARLLHERTCPGRVRDTAVVASVFATFLLIAGVSTASADHDGGTPSTRGVQPVVVAGNPSCADVAPGTVELKIQPVVAGTFSDGTLEFTITSVFDQRFFDWASNIGVDVVVVKGGPNANIYSYSPEATRDGSLH